MIKIGGLEIADIAAFDIRQSYTKLGGKSLLRTKNGTAVLQSRWQKLGATITGAGWTPDGLDGLNESIAHAVSCVAPLSVSSASSSITIPRPFRSDTDYAPQGVAIMPDGEARPTPAAIAANVATLTTVAGAVAYMVIYYPVITGYITVNRDFSEVDQSYSWTVEVEEA